MNKIIDYQDYNNLVLSGYGNFIFNDNDNLNFKKEKCDNCLKINENVIFWSLFLIKNMKNKPKYIIPTGIIKREEITNYIHMFNDKTYHKITIPNVNGNDMIITNKLDDFIKFIKDTGDSLFLIQRYITEQLLYDYHKIKYRYIIFCNNNKAMIYPLNLVLISKYKSKIENEKKQSYILHTDEKYKYSFGKEFYTRTLNRVKPILNDIKQIFFDITKFSKPSQYAFFAVDFIYDVDQNIYIDNIQTINDINFDKNVEIANTNKLNAYYGFLGKNVYDNYFEKKNSFMELDTKIEGFKLKGSYTKYIILLGFILWVVQVQKKKINQNMIVIFLIIIFLINRYFQMI